MDDRHRKEFEKEEREPISEQDFNEAMEHMFGPRTSVGSEGNPSPLFQALIVCNFRFCLWPTQSRSKLLTLNFCSV